jgi:hypothetical protein
MSVPEMRRLEFRLRCDVDCQMGVVLNRVVSQVIGLHYAPLVSAGGAHGGPEHAVVSWDLPTHRQSQRKEPVNTYTLLVFAVGDGAVIDDEKDMDG